MTDVRWRVQLAAGLPTSGWSALSTVVRHTDEVLRPHRWMSTWLDAKPGRAVELAVVGSAVESPVLFDSVRRRWIDGGFNGGPEIQVFLRDGDRAVDVWVAERERRALITWMSEHDARGGDSWLDRASMGDAPCLKVDADGGYWRCLR